MKANVRFSERAKKVQYWLQKRNFWDSERMHNTVSYPEHRSKRTTSSSLLLLNATRKFRRWWADRVDHKRFPNTAWEYKPTERSEPSRPIKRRSFEPEQDFGPKPWHLMTIIIIIPFTVLDQFRLPSASSIYYAYFYKLLCSTKAA